jgi:hypothetical protein
MLDNFLQSPELVLLRPGRRRAKLTVFTPRRFTLARSTCNWAYPPNCREVDRWQNPEHVVRPKSRATFRQHAKDQPAIGLTCPIADKLIAAKILSMLFTRKVVQLFGNMLWPGHKIPALERFHLDKKALDQCPQSAIFSM